MTPWLVYELRGRGLDVVCLDASMQRRAQDADELDGLERRGRTCADHAYRSQAAVD